MRQKKRVKRQRRKRKRKRKRKKFSSVRQPAKRQCRLNYTAAWRPIFFFSHLPLQKLGLEDLRHATHSSATLDLRKAIVSLPKSVCQNLSKPKKAVFRARSTNR